MQIDAAVNQRQLRRPDLQPRRRGGRRQHGHLQPVGRQRRHRLRRSRHDGHRGRRAAQERAAPSAAAGSASRSRTSTRTRRPASASSEPKGALVSEVTAERPGGRGRPQGRRRDPVRSTASKIADSRDLARTDRRLLARHHGRREGPARPASEQTVKVKLGTFPGTARSWPRSSRPSPARARRHRARAARPDAGPSVTGAGKDGVVDHRRRSELGRGPEGHQGGRRDPRGRRRAR